MIPETVVAEIRKRNDIVALIGEHVKLKRAGASYVGICPFHPDKDPSFSVHRDRQFFHCFGCHISGDVISFVMRMENHSFLEAVRFLAERAGIELPEIDSNEDAAGRREKAHRERLFAITQSAVMFFKQQFVQHPLARIAREELTKRKVDNQTVKSFQLGYAPNSWDALVKFLKKKGLSLDEAVTVGLIIARHNNSGYYDRFRHRLIFPIYDTHGRVVAFSGRALPELNAPSEKPVPKYINSPESPLYSKGSALFGLYQNRLEIRRNGWVVLCEGNFDLLALHQAGIRNAVAPLGTAFTQTQAHLIRKFAQRITLLFDGDAAGRKAVQAVYPLVMNAGLSARVANLPANHDPDSFVRSKGVESLIQLIDNSSGIVETLIDLAAETSNQQASDSASAIRNLASIMDFVESPIERHKYIERIAQRFEIRDVRTVHRELFRSTRQKRNKRGFLKKNNCKEYRTPVPTEQKCVNLPILQKELLGTLLDFPELFGDPEAKNLDELLTSEQLRFIFQCASTLFQKDGEISGPKLLAELEPRLRKSPVYNWLQERLAIQKTESVSVARDELRAGIPLVRKQNIERELQLLAQEIRTARRNREDSRALLLTKQRDELRRRSAHCLGVAQGLKG